MAFEYTLQEAASVPPWRRKAAIVSCIRYVFAYHFIYRFPPGESTYVAVIDIDIGCQFSTAFLFRIS